MRVDPAAAAPLSGHYPTGTAQARRTSRRRHVGQVWQYLIRISTVVGLIVLGTLLYNVINSVFGYILVQDTFSSDLLLMIQQDHVQLADSRSDAVQVALEDPHHIVLLSTELVPLVPKGMRSFGMALPANKAVLAVLVSQENEFLTAVGPGDLEMALLPEAQWSDLNSGFPAAPITISVVQDEDGVLNAWAKSTHQPALHSLSKEQLVTILEQNVSAGLMRRFEREQPFAQRSKSNVLDLVVARAIDPQIVDTFSLRDSLTRRDEIAALAQEHRADMVFKSWLTGKFLTSSQSSKAQLTGIRTAILGSLWVIAITIGFSVPLGIGAAIYLEEYSSRNRFERIIETNINNLAGVPSIIYGMLGLVIFVRALVAFTSGSLVGTVEAGDANGRTIISAGLTLGLLILPIIIINGQEAIRAVPHSLREASYGVGATKWQTTRHHVLPVALPGILTGAILAVSRALGETAPLVVIGAATFISVDPKGMFSKFTVLPIQIYQWTARPQVEFRNIAAAAILVLLAMLLVTNATAVFLRNRYGQQRI